MDVATLFNSVRRKIFDKEDLETSAFATLKKKGLPSQIHMVSTKSLGYVFCAFLTGDPSPKAGSGYLLFTWLAELGFLSDRALPQMEIT